MLLCFVPTLLSRAITIICVACVIFSAVSGDTITQNALVITGKVGSIVKDVNATLKGVVGTVEGVIDGVSSMSTFKLIFIISTY